MGCGIGSDTYKIFESGYLKVGGGGVDLDKDRVTFVPFRSYHQ